MAMHRNPGKFDTPLDEAIYSISLDGGPDEQAGSSSEAPYTWAGIMKDGRELAKAIRDQRAEHPHVTVTDLEFLRSDGSAGVIITEDSSGSVKVKYYGSERDLDKDWAETEETLNVGDELEPNGSGSHTYTVKYVHKISPSDRDVKHGIEIRDNAFSDKKKLGAALRSAGVLIAGAQVRSFRVEGDKVVVFPSAPGLTTYWHSIILQSEDGSVRPNARGARRGGGRGRMSPNSTIAERRAGGEIEGLTRAEMDSMEIRIPTFGWKQVAGDMDPGKHGGVIAAADGDGIELIWIQPVREFVGDGEAEETGYPFWSKEGTFDLSDLQLSDKSVQDAIEFHGLGEHLLDMTPEQRAVAIAVALIESGAGGEEGTSGWAKDVIGIGRIVKWASGTEQDWEYLADEDETFRMEVLGQRYEVTNDGMHVEWYPEDEQDEAIEEAEKLASEFKHRRIKVTDMFDREVLFDSHEGDDEEEGGALERNSRRRFQVSHTRNPRRWPTLMEGNDVMSQLVDTQAETLDPSGRGDVPSEVSGEISYTDEFIAKVFAYENALKKALEEVVERWPPLDDATADELFDDEAPYLVFMTLEGHGVGIWDGSWDKHFDRNQIEKVKEFLKQKLRKYADGSGSGSLPEAMDDLVYEAMRRAEYGFTDDGYAPLAEGGVLDVDFKENRSRPKGGSRFRGNGHYSLDFKLGVQTPNPTPNSSRVRWHVFLGDDLVDTVYMPPGLSAESVKRTLVSQGSNPNITVDQPPDRRSALPPHYQMRPNRSWTRAYINRLPDSAFLYIEPGGTKDDDNKTVPRSLRHFPYKSMTGAIDVNHLNNARARIGNSHVSEAAKREAFEKSERALREAR